MWGKEPATSPEMHQVYSPGAGVSVLCESPACDTQAGGRDGHIDIRPQRSQDHCWLFPVSWYSDLSGMLVILSQGLV